MDHPDNDRPLRILHLTAHSEPGGLSRYIHDLSLDMHQQGHDVRVAGNRGAWHWLFESAPFPYIEVPLDKGPFQMWQASRTLRKYLRDHPVDILHSHYRRTTVVARRLQRAIHPLILYTIHLSDIPIHWRARLWPDYGDHVHVASAEAKRWAIETAHVAPSNITMIPHGIHADQFPVPDEQAKSAARRCFNVNPDDRVAIFVGRLDSPKNEEWLLDVADRSRDSIPNLKILIAGKGPHEANLHQQIAHRKLNDRVIPVGELKDPLAVYQAADALLLPSQREGFSLVTAEAMSVGVPVCRTRTAGSAELIIDSETGRTTDIDRESFIRGAIDFLRDDASLRRMAANAPLHIRRHFTFERQLREMTALYRQLAGFTQNADTLGPAPSTRERAMTKKRFGQGNDVDRARPHFFHRDYWPLKLIHEGIKRFWQKHAAELKGKRVLDLGSGESPYTQIGRDAGAQMLAADIHPDDPTVLRIDPATGRVPLDDATIDAVLSTQVLEHVADVQAYLREAHRLLKPGGLLFCTTHGAFILHRHPTDYRRWTIDGLKYELEQAGFTIETLEPHMGILAMSTHLRSITFGGLTRRIPLTGWLRPIIYLFFNTRIAIEQWLTPMSVMESHPELLFATVRK